jgi:predicted enzyme related to lactoylglutathione lyase
MNGRKPIFIHYVHDMGRAQRFYESVFKVSPSFTSPGWTTLNFGSFELALHILSPGQMDEAPLPNAGLSLEAEQIEAMQASIEQYGGNLIEIREPQPHVPVRVASFRDSEGNGFELGHHVDDQGRYVKADSTNERSPYIIHYVHDMGRAQRFYEAVFKVSPSFTSPGWTTLNFGSFVLALHWTSPGEIDEVPLPHAGLNLEVDLIEEMQSLIERNGGTMIELREASNNVPDRVASFRDPEGNGFELRQHVGISA